LGKLCWGRICPQLDTAYPSGIFKKINIFGETLVLIMEAIFDLLIFYTYGLGKLCWGGIFPQLDTAYPSGIFKKINIYGEALVLIMDVIFYLI
jgi:hypothetical protein